MSTYISIGRLSEALLLLSAAKDYSCNSFAEVDHLTICFGINKRAAYDFAIQCRWLEESGVFFSYTDRGSDLVHCFKTAGLSALVWRTALYDYISICRPAWANIIPNGRKEVYLFMTNDEKRCFNEAALMESTDDDTVEWWDKVASLFRDMSQEVLEDIGREGERKALLYEERRTGVKPHWESIDSNCSGYDISSKKELGSDDNILIEVKSSKRPLKNANMIITRNEWDVASCDYNLGRYFFYLWLLGSRDQLAILPAEKIKEHVPNDVGCGQWKTLEIPFDLFEKEFKECVE
ncbi:MAG: DUF3883 domain-containing protein [Bacteroidales bacterium]|nr:DUF3883 domain-containing protein [Bacteroidales bacterium]